MPQDVVETQISSVMTRDVATLSPDADAEDALLKMGTAMISCVVICTDGKPVGILTERDMTAISAVSSGGAVGSGLTVEDVMSNPVTSVEESETLPAVLNLMSDAKFRHLPIIDAKGDLVGIVTQTDLLRACADLLASSEGR